MKLSEMKQILAAGRIQLTRSLGQTFLHDANQLRRIIQAADLQRPDKVLEIGPGLGPLTECLMERAGEVLAIEKDARLVSILAARFTAGLASNRSPASRSGAMPLLRLVHDDALDYLRRQAMDWSDWKLVANLPYSVASRILVELSQASLGPQRMVVTLQIEVARKLVAVPGDEDYGLLSLLVQLSYEPLNWFKIPATCFYPKPDVDSACVALLRRDPPLLPPPERKTFVQLVKRAFSQRRKMMLKLLKELWPADQLEPAFDHAKIPLPARAEQVSLQQFVRLARRLSAKSQSPLTAP